VASCVRSRTGIAFNSSREDGEHSFRLCRPPEALLAVGVDATASWSSRWPLVAGGFGGGGGGNGWLGRSRVCILIIAIFCLLASLPRSCGEIFSRHWVSASEYRSIVHAPPHDVPSGCSSKQSCPCSFRTHSCVACESSNSFTSTARMVLDSFLPITTTRWLPSGNSLKRSDSLLSASPNH
jgi:hypothetical protein